MYQERERKSQREKKERFKEEMRENVCKRNRERRQPEALISAQTKPLEGEALQNFCVQILLRLQLLNARTGNGERERLERKRNQLRYKD